MGQEFGGQTTYRRERVSTGFEKSEDVTKGLKLLVDICAYVFCAC